MKRSTARPTPSCGAGRNAHDEWGGVAQPARHGRAGPEDKAILVQQADIEVLVREHPQLQVHVSELGAPHVVDPERLERSARRLYGDTFDTLWGELVPVPAENVHVVGDRVLGLECFPTPGHASHHVGYLDSDGTLYAGDAVGVRIQPGEVTLRLNWHPVRILPPTAQGAWSGELTAVLPARWANRWGPNVISFTATGRAPGWSTWGVRTMALVDR